MATSKDQKIMIRVLVCDMMQRGLMVAIVDLSLDYFHSYL